MYVFSVCIYLNIFGIKGTSISSYADNNGYYEIDVTKFKDNSTTLILGFNYIGYKYTEVAISGKISCSQKIDVSMSSGEGINIQNVKTIPCPKDKRSR